MSAVLTSRNPLFIGSSLQTHRRTWAEATARAPRVVIPFSSGQVFRLHSKLNRKPPIRFPVLVVIPFSSGQVFRLNEKLARYQRLDLMS